MKDYTLSDDILQVLNLSSNPGMLIIWLRPTVKMRERLTCMQRRFWKYFFLLRIVILLSSQELMSCGRSLIQTLFLNRYFLLTIVLTNLWLHILIRTVSSWLQFRRGVYISFEERNSNRCTDLQVKPSITLFCQFVIHCNTCFNWVSWYD